MVLGNIWYLLKCILVLVFCGEKMVVRCFCNGG